ncbi:MAG: PilT protein domain protein [Phycisphaerales bacterium]|nr:PilT protein domain protein [Phycisphaerales bacterium]
MKVLLDTQIFLWFVMGDPRLSKLARDTIDDVANEKYLSAASAWEIAIKMSLGKLSLAEPFGILVPREISSNGFNYLPIELRHVALVVSLPLHHRDPFDRLLVAQSISEQMTLVSSDGMLDQYGIHRIA